MFFDIGFRPLTGTLLSKLFFDSYDMYLTVGFRPLTGTLLSKLKKKQYLRRETKVSVPSRGLSYLNFHLLRFQLCFLRFPSPHGDSLI